MAQYSVCSPLAFRNVIEEGKLDVRAIISNHFYVFKCDSPKASSMCGRLLSLEAD